MTRLQAYRIKRLNKEADALLAKAKQHSRPHVQSQFQIGYVPPIQRIATRSEKPRGRYWLLLICVALAVVYVNTSPSQAHDVCHVVAGN